MKTLKPFIKRISLVLAAFLSLSTLLLPAAAIAGPDVITPGCKNAPDSALCKDNNAQPKEDNQIYGPNGILTKAARIISFLVGAASIIVIMISGIRYVMSSGDPSNVNGAKNGILFAIVGLVVALAAQAIIVFVLNRLPN